MSADRAPTALESVLDSHGCCAVPDTGTDAAEAETVNRPGQPTIAYRMGVHGSFLHGMLRRLSTWPGDGRSAPLARLSTRDRTDPSIALLDAWATVADVLTFYQERIANEGYLRTATEQRSVFELARMIGYELNPGVAASTFLAFHVEDRPPPPGMGPPVREAVVPAGTRVQSMPGQGELPQTFESGSELLARPEWNTLRPRLTQPQRLSLASRRLYLTGMATGLARGRRILITAPVEGQDASRATRVLEVTDVAVETELGRTRVDLAEVGKPAPPPVPPPPFKPAPLPPAQIVLTDQPLERTYIKNYILDRRWTEKQLRAQRRIQYRYWTVRDLVDHVDYVRAGVDPFGLFERYLPVRVAPAVASHYPAAGASGVPHHADVLVTFNQPVDGATVTRSTLLLRTKATGDTVPSVVTYDEPSRTARLDPSEDLAPSTTYTVTVKGGRSGVADPAGLPMEADFTWSFQTDVERTQPEVIKHEPPQDAADVDPGVAVTATFSEPVQPDTVTAQTFTLQPHQGATVPASVHYDAGTGTGSLVPALALARDTTYTVTLTSAIKDVAGNALQPSSWNFTTKQAVLRPTEPDARAYAFREQAAFFGHNAPRWGGLPKADFVKNDPYPKDWDTSSTSGNQTNPGTPRTIWDDSQGRSLGGDRVLLDRAVPGITRESWAVFESPAGIVSYWVTDLAERSVADYALNGTVTELRLSQQDGRSPNKPSAPNLKVRETKAHLVSERLALADLPIDDPLLVGDREVVLDRMVLDLDEGRPVVLSGERLDLPGVTAHEVLILDEPLHQGGFTTLRFQTGLTHDYIRRTVAISANVVVATHGETVAHEILGGGDGSQPNPRFTLLKPPLTHVSAPTARGCESTLVLRVDGVRWDEARSLHDLGPRHRNYLLRIGNDGRASVVFGDGVHGARPASGTENVVASYRSGIGLAGMVAAEKLTLLQTRPLGIHSVTNPLPATGAQEPENRDEARRNAPLTVLTLDRIVSLADFEDFTRAFAGIGKAQATMLRRGERSLVHLTVAAANGGEVAASSPVYRNLVAAVDAARDPIAEVVIESCGRRYFNLVAKVTVDPSRLAADVLAAVQSALETAFSFERREFGQPVTSAEIITLVQGVPGVVMTDLDSLYLVQDQVREDASPAPLPDRPRAQILRANRAELTRGGTRPSELLLVNPAGITLTEPLA